MFRCIVVILLAALASPGMAEELNLSLKSGTGVAVQVWPGERTAVIVCDTWDAHHSVNAVRRMEEFVPRMNELLIAARAKGATIIHAPSDCMAAYEGHPARVRAQQAAKAEGPEGIGLWRCAIDSERGAVYPLDQSHDVEDDDGAEHAAWVEELKGMGRNPGAPWVKQHPGIGIDAERDYVSDRGDEVWNVLAERGISHVLLVGVHANMCVLGRPFGLRNLVRGGKQVALVRDLTDSMYNPTQWPYVGHFTGNDLLLDYVEKQVCPTITSDQILGGEAFRFSGDKRAERGLPVLPERNPEKEWTPTRLDADSALSNSTWYRCVVQPGAAAVEMKMLRLETAGAEAWVNGVKLAEGVVPAEAYRSGAPFWVVVRLGRDKMLRTTPGLSWVAGDKSGGQRVLAGGWQFRVDDGGDYSAPRIPAQFGASADMVVGLEE